MIFHPGDFGPKRVVRSITTVWRRGRQSIRNYRVRWGHRTAEDTDHDCDRLFCCGAHTCSCETRFGPVRGWTVDVRRILPIVRPTDRSAIGLCGAGEMQSRAMASVRPTGGGTSLAPDVLRSALSVRDTVNYTAARASRAMVATIMRCTYVDPVHAGLLNRRDPSL